MDPTRAITYTFKQALDSLFDRVNNTIHQAVGDIKNAAVDVEIQAGAEISRSIEQVKNAYENELEKTVEKISVEAGKSFNALNSIVAIFEKKAIDEMNDLMSQAQQLTNKLPFTSKQPQVRNVNPRYIVINDIAKTTFVTFKGNFFFAGTKEYEPVLNFGKNPCPLVDSTTESLTFQISQKDIIGHSKFAYTFNSGELSIPWDDGWILSHKKISLFRVGIGALPQVAGTGYVEYKSTETIRTEQHTLSPMTLYNGNLYYDGGRTHWKEILVPFYPKPGWLINPSVPPVVACQVIHGEVKAPEIIGLSATGFFLKINLYIKDHAKIGQAYINVGFNEYIDQTKHNLRDEIFEMNWRDSKLLEPRGNEVISKVVFENYKGTKQELAAPDISSGTLKAEAALNGKWKIWAEAPKELQISKKDLSLTFNQKLENAHKFKSLLDIPVEFAIE